MLEISKKQFYSYLLLVGTVMCIVGAAVATAVQRATFEQQQAIIEASQPAIAADIIDAEIQKAAADSPTAERDPLQKDIAITAFTGSVTSIKDKIISVERTGEKNLAIDAVKANVLAGTSIVDATTYIGTSGLIEVTETDIALTDIELGDIVTVYSEENMLEEMVVNAKKIQRFVPAIN